MQEAAWVASVFAVILAVMAQTTAIVWFLSRINSRVENLEKSSDSVSKEGFPVRLAKIEVIMEIVQTQQDEQIKKLEEIRMIGLRLAGGRAPRFDDGAKNEVQSTQDR